MEGTGTMKSLFKVLVLVAIAFVISGFINETFLKEQYQTETRTFVERVHSGDTFNGVIEQYYDPDINVSWDEWQTRQKQNNKDLFKNGRALQPGDKIVIITKVRVAK